MDRTAPPLAQSDLTWLRTDWNVIFNFQVEGTPKPKARPRFRRTANFVQTYTPETTVNWEQTIVRSVKETLASLTVTHPGELDVLPLTGRICAVIRINCVRPKSTPKSVQYPLKARPGDVDNLAKSVLDALQLANVIADDKTVSDLTVYKRFATEDHPEGVEVALAAYLDAHTI